MNNCRKCFGIVSYFTWEQPERKQRQDRLDRLVNQLSNLWPDIDILIIAQQWKHYKLDGKCKNKVIRYDYPKLGILKARQTLREEFLKLDYDYIIMFDDDAIIEYDSIDKTKEYMDKLDKNPEGFCFIKEGKGCSPHTGYASSQLNLCAISRYLYEKENIPKVDPQKGEGFEDRIYSLLLHIKYADKEFDPPKGIRCIHFRNKNEPCPSTWTKDRQKYNCKNIEQRTIDIESCIINSKELPDKWKA